MKLKKELKELARLRPAAFGKTALTESSASAVQAKDPQLRDAESPMYRAAK